MKPAALIAILCLALTSCSTARTWALVAWDHVVGVTKPDKDGLPSVSLSYKYHIKPIQELP